MRFDDATWDRWVCWVGKIKTDLAQTIDDQAVFRRFGEVCLENEAWIRQNDGHYFCTFVFRCYGARAVLGIRRHLKNDDDSISLARLLNQMELCGSQITLDYYRNRFPENKCNVKWQRKTFMLLSDDGRTVTSAIVQSDLEKLRRINDDIETYVDRTVAHLDKRGHSVKVGFKDIEGSLNYFNRLACRYICFLTGEGYTTLEATIQYDWDQVFRIQLIKPQ